MTLVDDSLTCDDCVYTLLTVKAAELVDLFRELEGVGEWLHLGLYLGVRLPRLMDIKSENQLTTECREQVLIERQKQLTPLTWSAVVKALVGIRREGLAAHLASKYGMFAMIMTYSSDTHAVWGGKYSTLYSATWIYRNYIFTFGVQPAVICLHGHTEASSSLLNN